jgi:hypothetical protein
MRRLAAAGVAGEIRASYEWVAGARAALEAALR